MFESIQESPEVEVVAPPLELELDPNFVLIQDFVVNSRNDDELNFLFPSKCKSDEERLYYLSNLLPEDLGNLCS